MSGPPLGGGRRDTGAARAIHLLYEADQRSVGVDEVLDDQVMPADEYTAALLHGVEAERADLDATIGRLARGWTLERMPAMDRLVLEVALFELSERPEIPTAVILNEAVELANQYSTDDSGRFVNGVLASAATELRG